MSTKLRGDTAAEPLTRTYIAEWRKYRQLSLRKLAALADLTASRISQIELGREPYNQRFIEACAKALQCRVIDLLFYPPPGTISKSLDEIDISAADHAGLMRQLVGEIEVCKTASEGLNQQLLFLGTLATQLIGRSEAWEQAIKSFLDRAGRLYPK